MNLETEIRKLARGGYWQNIYRASKENSGIHLFENKSNFSGIQSEFLYWLSTYNSLYEELAKCESPFLSRKMLKDSVRVDAYLYYRRKKNEQEWKKHNQQKHAPIVKNKCRDNLTTFTVDNRRP